MKTFFFNLKEVSGVEEATQILVTNTIPTPQTNGFKSANINYADLSPQDKATYDNFVAMVKSKCT